MCSCARVVCALMCEVVHGCARLCIYSSVFACLYVCVVSLQNQITYLQPTFSPSFNLLKSIKLCHPLSPSVIVEGEDDRELPEQIVGATFITGVDLVNATRVDFESFHTS